MHHGRDHIGVFVILICNTRTNEQHGVAAVHEFHREGVHIQLGFGEERGSLLCRSSVSFLTTFRAV